MKKEFSITVLGDLPGGISFLRFLEHFWNRWNGGTHWNTCSTRVTENFTGKLRHNSLPSRYAAAKVFCGRRLIVALASKMVTIMAGPYEL
jgi:hypothetical protein